MNTVSNCYRLTSRKLVYLAILFLAMSNARAAPITNKDVLSLLEAGMTEDVIIQAIAQGEPKFDTSSSALIKLKQKGATPALLKVILSPKGPQTKPSKNEPSVDAAAAKKAISNDLNPEEVTISQNGELSTMQYIIPNMRTAARALGFGGVATYASLSGTRAQLRLKSPLPEFIISVPKNAQAGNYMTLANFAIRNNGTREVLTGGGYMSYTTGIHRDRVVAITTEKMEDQSRAKEGFILYQVKPTSAIKAGEYALVLYTGEIRTAGFFAQASNSYFDFGVD